MIMSQILAFHTEEGDITLIFPDELNIEQLITYLIIFGEDI